MALTKEQIEERRKGIGGSDVSVIFNVNPFKSQLQLWLEKTGTDITEENLQMEVGSYMEDFVAKKWAKNNNKEVRRHNSIIWSKNPKTPHLFANVDRIVVGEDALLECKTAGAYASKHWKNGEIPVNYLMQVWHYLYITEKSQAYIACLIGNNQFVERIITINDLIPSGEFDEYGNPIMITLKNFLPIMAEKCEKWYVEHVINGKMPEYISCSDTSTLLELYPNDSGESIELGEWLDREKELLDADKEYLKSLEASIKQRENMIKSKLGNASVGKGGIWNVEWKTQFTSGKFDKEMFEKDFPGIYEKYITKGITRILRFKKNEK